jgi:hypothetical protein
MTVRSAPRSPRIARCMISASAKPRISSMITVMTVMRIVVQKSDHQTGSLRITQ